MNQVPRVRRLALLVGAVVLLVGLGAGAGRGADSDPFIGRSAFLGAIALVGPGPAGAPDTRLQRDVGFGERHLGSRVDCIGGPLVQAQASRARGRALAAAIERAGHPERVGHILLRGPPAPSA